MYRFDSFKKKRTAAGIIAFMMLFAVLLSALFIAVESGHDCDEHDCPICSCIQMCERTLSQTGAGAVLETAAVLPFFIFVVFVSLPGDSVVPDTPVSNKIRLNN